jgi:pSer/pThr/pTyr-binding forkhead associated (FHA) protein
VAPRSIPPPFPRPSGGGGPAPAPPGRTSSPPASGAGVYAGTLSVIYNGERLAVNKDRFVIGRGKQSSDLTIKDPNVSRQHAMVEFLNGQYYMVDMGSTNGVEYQGQRVSRRAISEGDVFRICDHEVRFTYH